MTIILFILHILITILIATIAAQAHLKAQALEKRMYDAYITTTSHTDPGTGITHTHANLHI